MHQVVRPNDQPKYMYCPWASKWLLDPFNVFANILKDGFMHTEALTVPPNEVISKGYWGLFPNYNDI